LGEKTFYAVMGLFRKLAGPNNLSVVIEDCAGVIPVFYSREEAERFSEGRWDIVELRLGSSIDEVGEGSDEAKG